MLQKQEMSLEVLILLLIMCNFSLENNETANNKILNGFRESRIFWTTFSSENNILYNDPLPVNQESFDFIIVGSGSAGAALANRLSENKEWKILLLEAGDVATPLTDIPALAPVFQQTKLDWGYVAEKEKGSCWGCPNQRMRWPRGRCLGGSTVINAMIHVRGNRLDYDKWAAAGNPGWAFDDVLPYFKKLEDSNVEKQDTEYRGKGGPVPVVDVPYRTESAKAFVKAAQEAEYPYVDYNGKDQMGVSFVQANIKSGLRCSVEKAYLRAIRQRKNLKISINSRVTKILLNERTKEAYGLEFIRNGKYYKITATKEVILSAGAFNSPQLLMLSGIGPRDHLNELGINAIKDLPVGKKLYDHITFLGLNFLVNKSITATSELYYNVSNIVDLLVNGNGPLTLISGVEALMYFKTKIAKQQFIRYKENYPDMEAIFLGSNLSSDKGAIFKDTNSVSSALYNGYWKNLEKQSCFQILPMLIHPKSHGYLKLKSKNPFHWPKFYPQYFTDTHNEDIKTFIAAIREIIRISEMPALQKYGTTLYDKPIPGCENYTFNSDPYWECALRTASSTLHHQVATCKMGPGNDPEAVVDRNLRVHGIKNLRVADTSVIPLSLSAHTNIPSIMIGEKAADIIKEDWYNRDVASKIDLRIG